jgi:hypothetical protein
LNIAFFFLIQILLSNESNRSSLRLVWNISWYGSLNFQGRTRIWWNRMFYKIFFPFVVCITNWFQRFDTILLNFSISQLCFALKKLL